MKIKYVLIAYFLSNILAKNCCNRMVYVKIIASQRWDVSFETECVLVLGAVPTSNLWCDVDVQR